MLTSHGQHRYEELDSLRGVAAMIVVFHHVGLFWNMPFAPWHVRFDQSPLGILMDGSDAVLLFFTMSGFVLFLPYLRTTERDTYPRFLVKRVCRIYLPYLAALALSIAADVWFYRPLDGMFPRWYGWHRPFPMAEVWWHVLFIGRSGLAEFNPAFWSLVHEMRISIAFPLVAYLALRLPLGWGFGVCMGLCFGGFMLEDMTQVTYFSTLGYSGLFVLGALIARYLQQIRVFVESKSAFGKTMILIAGFAFLKSTHLLSPRNYQFWAIVPLHGTAVAIFMILALTTVYFRRFLHTVPLRWLGKVSYSLYLIHGIILYSLASLFWQKTSHHILLLLSGVGLALLVVGPFYHWVERPSILLGRRLTRRQPAPVTATV